MIRQTRCRRKTSIKIRDMYLNNFILFGSKDILNTFLSVDDKNKVSNIRCDSCISK